MTEEKKDVVPSHYRELYKTTGGTNGDFIATELSRVGASGIEALNSVKAENKIEANRWSTFNSGMQRMNLANVLRSAFLKGETITILGKQYNAKHQAEDFNGVIANNEKMLSKLADYLQLTTNKRAMDALQKLFFPPEKKGPTAEERAATKATKEAEKTAAKEAKAKGAAENKTKKEAEKLADKEKAKAAKLAKADKTAKA